MNYPTVIIADGAFPTHETPISYIRNAERLVCCDGSTESLVDFGLEPTAIVGDMDSLPDELAKRYSGRIFRDSDQETNDLTKAVMWCNKMGYNEIAIVGATGKREDHTIGNISLLAEYCQYVNIVMVTDSAILIPYLESCDIPSFPGQQVSVFSINPETEITSSNLKYPLRRTRLSNWWMATLNECTGESFRLEFSTGRIIVYLKFRD